jgi:hypothetical protein
VPPAPRISFRPWNGFTWQHQLLLQLQLVDVILQHFCLVSYQILATVGMDKPLTKQGQRLCHATNHMETLFYAAKHHSQMCLFAERWLARSL